MGVLRKRMTMNKWRPLFRRYNRKKTLWRLVYNKYLASDEWKAKRKEWIIAAKNTCISCKDVFGDGGLHIHHIHYRTIGDEKDSDIRVVCRGCHKMLDEHRVLARTGTRVGRKWNKRLNGWQLHKHTLTRQEAQDDLCRFLESEGKDDEIPYAMRTSQTSR